MLGGPKSLPLWLELHPALHCRDQDVWRGRLGFLSVPLLHSWVILCKAGLTRSTQEAQLGLSASWGLHMELVDENVPLRDFPGSPVVKPLPSTAGGVGLIPSEGAKIP